MKGPDNRTMYATIASVDPTSKYLSQCLKDISKVAFY